MFMEKNVFMTSMYFFIPLYINEEVSNNYNETKSRKYKEIKVPLGARESSFRCAYYDDIMKERRCFYYTHHSKWVKIEIVPYILKCQPIIGKKNSEYFFVISAIIDKWILSKEKNSNEEFVKQLCTEDDIVCLKNAFYGNGNLNLHQTPCETDNHTLKEWAIKIITKIEGVNKRKIKLNYSIVNITCEAIDISDNERIEENFSAKYYEYPHKPLEKNILGNYKQFIYGVLFGNDHYIRVPKQEIKRVIENSYTNNDTEMTYAGRRSIVFLKTHTPFEEYPTSLPFIHPYYNLEKVPNIYELCSALYIEKQMRTLRNPEKFKNNPYDIKAFLSSLVGNLYVNNFYIRSADEKSQYIFEALGLIREFENVKQIAGLRAESDNIRITQNTNNIIKWLTFAMFLLCLIQIIPLLIKLNVYLRDMGLLFLFTN